MEHSNKINSNALSGSVEIFIERQVSKYLEVNISNHNTLLKMELLFPEDRGSFINLHYLMLNLIF